ncbi:hypothetical protein ACSQ67_025591 [Phaseolus vulgaris]
MVQKGVRKLPMLVVIELKVVNKRVKRGGELVWYTSHIRTNRRKSHSRAQVGDRLLGGFGYEGDPKLKLQLPSN